MPKTHGSNPAPTDSRSEDDAMILTAIIQARTPDNIGKKNGTQAGADKAELYMKCLLL
jgi:hypothetical protein